MTSQSIAMHPLPANKQARHLKAACTLLIVASIAHLLYSAATYSLDLIYTSKYDSAEHPLGLHGFRALLVVVAAFASPLAVVEFMRARIFSAKHQQIILFLLFPCIALIAADTLLLRWQSIYTAWHFQHVSDHYIRTDLSLRNKLFTQNSDSIFASAKLLFAASAVWLLFPPKLNLYAWRAAHQRTLLLFAGSALFLLTIRAAQSINMATFERDIIDALMDRAPKTFVYYFTYSAWKPAQIAFELAILTATIYLFHLRRNVPTLTQSPNHCAACDYPLDTHMTTCPECGHSRTPQQPPLPEG